MGYIAGYKNVAKIVRTSFRYWLMTIDIDNDIVSVMLRMDFSLKLFTLTVFFNDKEKEKSRFENWVEKRKWKINNSLIIIIKIIIGITLPLGNHHRSKHSHDCL